MPFASPEKREIHFKKHGHKFPAANPIEYEQMAEAFLYGPMGNDTRECNRNQSNDRLRFDILTRFLGVACLHPEFIRTFYPVERSNIAASGGPENYFSYKCRERP